MEAETKTTETSLHWKWYIGYFIARGSDRVLQRMDIAPDLSFVIAVFFVFQVCYFLPPKTNVTYSRFMMWLIVALGWYFVVMRFLFSYLETVFPWWGALLITFSILFLVPIILVPLIRKNILKESL